MILIRKRFFSHVTILILFMAVANNIQAQVVSQPRQGTAGTWRLLGTTQAKFTADHDAFVVNAPYDFFRKLKFKVTNAPLNIVRLVVLYDDGGSPEKIDTRFNIPQGGESRIIELKGGKRKLKSVEFWYDTQDNKNGRADLTLFGMK